jgi:hypothetical protein
MHTEKGAKEKNHNQANYRQLHNGSGFQSIGDRIETRLAEGMTRVLSDTQQLAVYVILDIYYGLLYVKKNIYKNRHNI